MQLNFVSKNVYYIIYLTLNILNYTETTRPQNMLILSDSLSLKQGMNTATKKFATSLRAGMLWGRNGPIARSKRPVTRCNFFSQLAWHAVA